MTARSPLFTVFTATYNRAHTLHRVHDSLAAQTMRDFEWLIVDDGSDDGTADLVAGWRRDADFPIRYLTQAHRGKHVASNHAAAQAAGTFLIGLDSDDECRPTALERFKAHWDAIPVEDRGDYVGVTGLCADQHGDVVGDYFPHNCTDSDPLEIRYRYGVTGEKWGFNRVDVLRRHPWPEITNQPAVPDSLVWNRIAREHLTRYVNEVFRTYHVQGSDSITATTAEGVVRRSPAFALRNQVVLDEEIDWFRYAPWHFARTAANYSRFCWHEGTGFLAQHRALSTVSARFLHLMAAPAAAALHWRDVRSTADA